MALAYGSHLHLGLIWDSFQKMSKEVTYFQRLILVMNINFPQPFSKIFCPQMVNKYLPRLNQTKKQQIKQKTIPKQTNKQTYLKPTKFKILFLGGFHIPVSLKTESWRREDICLTLHSPWSKYPMSPMRWGHHLSPGVSSHNTESSFGPHSSLTPPKASPLLSPIITAFQIHLLIPFLLPPYQLKLPSHFLWASRMLLTFLNR